MMLWDPVFGWDWDRIRLILFGVGFLYLFTGFITATEGGSFFDPTKNAIAWITSNEVPVLIAVAVLSAGAFAWWRREVGF